LKFSFINASVIESEGHMHEKARGSASSPPLGILYLGAVLRNHGVEVSALDQPAKGLTVEEAVNWASKEDPDILGFSTFSSSGRTAVAICKRAKEQNPNIVTVFGNIYATLNPERILMKYPSIDLIVRGEGERTVTELVSRLGNGGDLREVRGISFREGGKIISNPDRPLIENLDSIPFPDRKLLDSDYHCMILGVNVAPKKFTSIVSSRGCVYRCRFCNCTQFCQNRWRHRSVQNTLEELNLLVGDGYKQFIFSDDNFTTNKKRVIELCRAIRREKMDVDLICEGRVDNCSYEMLWEMARAGCRVMYFGIESANQRILDYYNKQATPQQAENAVKTARKAGMDIIIGSFIVGAPDETREEIQNTINFAKKNPIDFPQFNILGVYPGMDIWSELVAKQIINEEEYWESGVPVSKVCPDAVPFQDIKRMLNEALYDFLKRPSFILEELARTSKSAFRMNTLLSNVRRAGAIREGLSNMF
jgi:anaerobic magnesium-protoporphyrin IX monomethyl ester cyclase